MFQSFISDHVKKIHASSGDGLLTANRVGTSQVGYNSLSTPVAGSGGFFMSATCPVATGFSRVIVSFEIQYVGTASEQPLAYGKMTVTDQELTVLTNAGIICPIQTHTALLDTGKVTTTIKGSFLADPVLEIERASIMSIAISNLGTFSGRVSGSIRIHVEDEVVYQPLK